MIFIHSRRIAALSLTLAGAFCAPALADDLATVAMTQPVSGCALTGSEDVTIRLFNYGSTLTAGSAFNVSYTINGGPPVTEMIVLGANLLTDSQLDYTFTTQADLSAPGTYSFDATVALPGDTNPTNNTFAGYLVRNDAPSGGGVVSGPGSPGSSGTLTLAGQTGGVVQWEESTDGLRWSTLANATTTQDFADLRTPTQFRARTRNGACPEALSNTVQVTP